MSKPRRQKLWALWNYTNIIEVRHTRRDARTAANELMCGGKPDADEMFTSGAFRITKILVTEL